MRKGYRIAAAVVCSAVLLVAVTGCTRVRLQDTPSTAVQTMHKTVDLGGATHLDTTLRMGVGELTLKSLDTSVSAMSADFEFAPTTWKPEVTYSVSGSDGTLLVRQPENIEISPLKNARNNWTVRLAKGIPTDLRLGLGVGTSDVDLRGIDLESLDVTTGVGKTTIDLSGPRARGLSGRIESGVGDLTLRLPASVGARVTGGKDGLGDFTADGVGVNSAGWVNDAYSGSGPKIEIELKRGIGNVTILLVD